MFSEFIDSITDFGKMLKDVTDTNQEFTESYLQNSWNNKLSTVFSVFYQYHLSLKALISESDDNYDDVIDKLEKKHPIPNYTSPSGLWAIGFADTFYDEKRNIKIFKKFILIAYKAPNDPFELQDHLFSLYLYYMRFKPTVISFEFASQIDNVTTELVTKASRAMLLHREARNDHIRTSRSTRTIRKKVSDKKQIVLEVFYKIRKRENEIPHRIATAIQKHMKEFGKKPPAPETIKKYLREEGLMEK